MFKYGDINEETLLWQQGQVNDIGHEVWLPLSEIVILKYKVTECLNRIVAKTVYE